MHLLQLVGHSLGGDRVLLEEERDRQLGVVDAARGVDPWRDAERQIARGRPFRSLGGARQQRPQPRPLAACELVQPQPNDRPALPGHRRHVGDRADRRDPGQIGNDDAATRDQGGRHLVGDAGARQVRVRICAVRALRIDDRQGARQRTGGQVVISDDDVHPQPPRDVDLLDADDPAVAGDHQPHAGGGQLLEAAPRQPIAIGQSRRDVTRRLGADGAQRDGPDRHRGHAIGVIVAPDGDPLAGVQGPLDARQRDVGIGHQADVVQ